MKLFEFFGRTLDKKSSSDKENDKFSKDELFWYIIDEDKLHKEYFFPLAKKIKQDQSNGKLDKSACVNEFMPMVKEGCRKFCEKKKLVGKLGKLFPSDMREDLCQRLFDHYYDDVVKEKYQLGN